MGFPPRSFVFSVFNFEDGEDLTDFYLFHDTYLCGSAALLF